MAVQNTSSRFQVLLSSLALHDMDLTLSMLYFKCLALIVWIYFVF
jgi:hypothetical protein